MKLKKRIAAIALLVILPLAACARVIVPPTEPAAEATAAPAAAETAAAAAEPFTFSGTALDGTGVDETLFTDHKLTMVNIWGTFCGYCIDEMPDLADLADEYADRGFQIVGVIGDIASLDGVPTDEERKTIDSLIEQTNADYLHLLPMGDTVKLFLANTRAYPTTFFLDSAGNMLTKPVEGALSRENWVKLIEALLDSVEK